MTVSYQDAAKFGMKKSSGHYLFHQIHGLLNECKYDVKKWPEEIGMRASNLGSASSGFPQFVYGCPIHT